MVSEATKKKAAQKKAAAAAKRGGKAAAAASSKKAAAAASESQNGADKLANGVGAIQISDRTCTGVLCSHPLSRDIRVSTEPMPALLNFDFVFEACNFVLFLCRRACLQIAFFCFELETSFYF